MKYAKLINGCLTFEPNPVLYNGFRIGNPRPDLIRRLGYKPIHLSNTPEPLSPTGWWAETWAETDTEILQGWSWQEPGDGGASPD